MRQVSTVSALMPPPISGGKNIADSQVDTIIADRLSPAEQAFVRSELLTLPAAWRGTGVIIRTLDGKLHANTLGLLQASIAQQRQFTNPHSPGQSGIETIGPSALGVNSNGSHPLASPNGIPTSCPTWNLGGKTTGPFRRVYIGCEGYTTQVITFQNPDCNISDQLKTGIDFHSVIGGAYNQILTGIDAGLVYVNKPNGTPYWEEYTSFGGVFTYGAPNVPCGGGTYQIDLQIQASDNGNNQWVLGTSGGGVTPTALIIQVPSSTFTANGSNFIFRRLTGIGQKPENDYSTEFFGFLNNGNGGPNLSVPEIAFSETDVGNLSIEFQLTTENSYAEINPARLL